MKSLEPKRLSRITPRDLCITIARAKMITGRKSDSEPLNVLTTAENIWLAAGRNMETLIKWYIMSLVKLEEGVPPTVLKNLLDSITNPSKRAEYESILTSFNKAMEGKQ